MNVLKLTAFSHNGQGENPAVVKFSTDIGSSVLVSGETRYIID